MNLKASLKISILVVAASMLTALASGCRAANKDAESGSGLQFASMWEEKEDQAQFLKEVAKSFEQETGIHVDFKFYGRNVMSMIKSRMRAGDPPDIVEQSFHILDAFAAEDRGNLVDLKEMFYNESGPEGQARLIDVLDEKAISLYERDGKMFMFPYEFLTSGFFYNKVLFDRFGLQEPVTWNDFMRNNEVLKQNQVSPLALDTNVYNNFYYGWLIDRILGPKSLRKALEDASGSVWDQPGYLQAAELVYELGKGGKQYFQDGYEKTEWPNAQYEWAKGKYGSLLVYTWIPSETLTYTGDNFKYGFYPFPLIEGGAGQATDVEVGFIGLSIYGKSKKIDDAKAFFKYILQEDNARKFVNATHRISVRKDIPYPEVMSSIQSYVESAESYHVSEEELYLDYPGWWPDIYLPLNTQLITGVLTPKQFIEKIKSESIAYLKTKE